MTEDKQLVEWLGENNDIGQDIWRNKYQYNNETFDEWLNRVSGGDSDIKEEIETKRFLFGGRILANRGLYKDDIKVTYSNCYVLPPPEDNIESIYDTAKELARTFSYGGGVGIDISNLAPRGAKVHNTAKETSGAVSFMDLYSATTGLIGQNGRRGALMISIDCSHPDLEEFIDIKSDLDKVTTANISIRMDDEFMTAVERDQDIELRFVRPETDEEIVKRVNARNVFNKIAFQNWDMGEPGILFWDRIKNWNLLSEDKSFEYAGTNPCAEEPLPAYGSCLLGSINLSEFVNNPYTDKSEFDYGKLQRTTYRATRALNDVLDEGLPLHPLEGQKETVRDWRQIGLGVFGIADMLIKMGIEYGSVESLKLFDKIGSMIAKSAIMESNKMAREFGAYPNYNDKVTQSKYMRNLFSKSELETINLHGLRNSQLLTIAPTGSLSTMLQVSGGIEPYFATSWQRTTKSLHGEDVTYTEHPKAITELMNAIGIDEGNELPSYVVTSSTISPTNRIRTQATWQKYIDASISSTVNLPKDTSVEDVANIYMEAWKEGLKGITVFRDGCRRLGILTTSPDGEDTTPMEFERGDIVSVSDDLLGAKRRITNGCGDFQEQVFFDEFTGEAIENYIAMGDGGGCERNMEAISRLISLCWRGGIDISEVVKQLKKVRTCPAYRARTMMHGDTSKGTSCPSAIGYAIEELNDKIQERVFTDEEEIENNTLDDTVDADSVEYPCPECGEALTFEGGCNICKSCGWSKCD